MTETKFYLVTLNGVAPMSEIKAKLVALGFDRFEELAGIGVITAWGAEAAADKAKALPGVWAVEESMPASHC